MYDRLWRLSATVSVVLVALLSGPVTRTTERAPINSVPALPVLINSVQARPVAAPPVPRRPGPPYRPPTRYRPVPPFWPPTTYRPPVPRGVMPHYRPVPGTDPFPQRVLPGDGVGSKQVPVDPVQPAEAQRRLATRASKIQTDIEAATEERTRRSYRRGLSHQERELIKKYAHCIACQSVTAGISGNAVPGPGQAFASCALSDLEEQALKRLGVTDDLLLLKAAQEIQQDLASMTEVDRQVYYLAAQSTCN